MIALTRTSGEFCSLDPAHVVRIEAHPTTVVYLTDGARYCVDETADEVIDKIRRCRADALTRAWRIVGTPGPTAASDGRGAHAAGALAGGSLAGVGARRTI